MRSLAVVIAAAVLVVVGCTSDPDDPPRGEPPRTSGPSDETDFAHRAVHSLTPLRDGTLLVAGGCVVDGCTTATASAYLVGPEGATAAADLGGPRDGHTATLLADGRVLAVGGYSGEGEPPLQSAEIFDPATGSWTRVGDLAAARGGHAAALLGDGRVVIAGGWTELGVATATTEMFDPATETFSPGPALPRAVDGLAATSLADGSVLIAGGVTRDGAGSATAVRIDPAGALREVGPLRTGRFKHALVTLPSGEALALGGTPDDRHLLRTTEVFDPRRNRFRVGPRLQEGRYKLNFAAAVLPDGRVAVAGGGPGVEIVDVAGGRSSLVNQAGGDWASFSAVGVSDGRLVVVGGYDQQIQLTGTDLAIPLTEL